MPAIAGCALHHMARQEFSAKWGPGGAGLPPNEEQGEPIAGQAAGSAGVYKPAFLPGKTRHWEEIAMSPCASCWVTALGGDQQLARAFQIDSGLGGKPPAGRHARAFAGFLTSAKVVGLLPFSAA